MTPSHSHVIGFSAAVVGSTSSVVVTVLSFSDMLYDVLPRASTIVKFTRVLVTVVYTVSPGKLSASGSLASRMQPVH